MKHGVLYFIRYHSDVYTVSHKSDIPKHFVLTSAHLH